MIVRQAEIADVAVCAAIEMACFPPAEAASAETVAKRQAVYPQGFLVAEAAGEIVGFINSGATDEPDLADEEFKGLVGHDPDGAHLVIFSIAVHPSRQGQGFARLLLEAFIERAEAQAKGAVLLLCKEDLVPFYERFGFLDGGVSASTHGGARWHEMRLPL